MLVAVYPAPLGLDVPAPRPLPHRQPPPIPLLPAGGQFKPERAGRRRLGLAGGGTHCRQKTAAVRGRGPSPLGRGFAVCPASAPGPRAQDSRRCAPLPPTSSPGCARFPSPALDGCHGNGAWAPPPEGFVCTSCSCCLCLAPRMRVALLPASRPSVARASGAALLTLPADWGSDTRPPCVTLTQMSTPTLF